MCKDGQDCERAGRRKSGWRKKPPQLLEKGLALARMRENRE
jgi:hypothetical protein